MTFRYKDEEEQSSYSALDHIHRFSEMRKLDESELSDGDGDGDEEDGSFGSPSLTEAVKQPLFRKSKSQVDKDAHTHTRTLRYRQSICTIICSVLNVFYVNNIVNCNPPLTPSGLCHDAVPGWKGHSSPSYPHPSHHVAQSGTGCRWIQCHPIPQPCMMTPLCAYLFSSQPDPDPATALAVHCRGYFAGVPDCPQSDCWAGTTAHPTAEWGALHGHCPCKFHPNPSPPPKKTSSR